jgi:serine/threonine protein kinase
VAAWAWCISPDPRLERLVAIKALNEELGSHPDRLARFEREARTLASINNPNIAMVYGMDEELGRQLLVMEFVPGNNLSTHAAQRARSTPRRRTRCACRSPRGWRVRTRRGSCTGI